MTLLFLALFSCSSATPTPAPVEPQPATITLKADPLAISLALLPADQAAVITHAANGLATLCAKSQRACEVQYLFRENGVPAVVVPEGVQVVQAPDVQYPLLVVADTTAQHTPGTGSFSAANFRWSPEMPAPLLELHDNHMTEFGAGLMLAHELVHAEERFYRNEPVSHYPEPNWIIGEVVAHSAVNTILNQFTDGRWQREVVDARVARIESFIAAHDMDPDLSFNGRPEEDAPAIKVLFPGSDDATIGALMAQADIDATLQRIGAIAKRRNISHDQRQEAMISAMQAFYTQMGFHEE